MNTTKGFFALIIVIAAAIVGYLLHRHYTEFILHTRLLDDESIGQGTPVSLDGEPVGAVTHVAQEGNRRFATFVVTRRETFKLLRVGLCRISGVDEIKLMTGLTQVGAPPMERGASVPAMSTAEYYAARYLDPSRWPGWATGLAGLALAAFAFRKPLARLVA